MIQARSRRAVGSGVQRPSPRTAGRPHARRGAAARLLAFALVGATALPATATAQDWSLTGRFAQGFSAETNRTLDNEGDDTSFGSTTTLGLEAAYLTPRTRWGLSTGVALRAFTGGDSDEDVDIASPRLNGSVAHVGIGWRLTGNASFRRSNTSFNSIADAVEFPIDPGGGDGGGDGGGGDGGGDAGGGDGGGGDGGGGIGTDIVSDEDATRTDISFATGLTLNLTQLDTVSFNFGSSIVRFSENDADLEPSTSFFGGANFSRRLTQRTSLNTGLSLRQFQIDDERNTSSIGFTAQAGISRQVSPRMSASFSAGATLSRIERDAFGILPAETTTTISPSGTASITYQEGETRIGLSLTQAVTPDSDGDINDRTSIGFRFSQPINRTQSVSLSSGLSRSSSTDGDGDSGTDIGFEVSPSYSIRLTEDWQASVSYRFRLGNDDNGTAISNGVFLNVSRPLVLY
ncbi:MAG: hypothetical protein AAF577_08380 [Pseudomonadota bacterium]